MGAHTLSGPDYYAPDVFELEKERIFYRSWLYVCREEDVAIPARWRTVAVLDESILLIRGKDGVLRGFYNVCRHRGTRLCDGESGRAVSAIRCPYHAWGYRDDGSLVSTPNVPDGELDRDQLGLKPVHVQTWLGFVFVNLDRDEPVELRASLAAQYDNPLLYERFGLDQLRIGHRSSASVAANWKIIIGNYNECLHCPIVHPQLVARVPAYRTGELYQDGLPDGAIGIVDSDGGLAPSSRSRFAPLPGMTDADRGLYFGSTVLPNMFIDITNSEAVITRILPTGPESCVLESEYLFAAADLAAPGFDPSEFVEFNETVNRQDIEVCERLQLGVRSRSFEHGVYPSKDEYVAAFERAYLAEMRTPGTAASSALV
jgi:Rieske 2Fe-2S family protein